MLVLKNKQERNHFIGEITQFTASFLLENLEASKDLAEAKNRVKYFLLTNRFFLDKDVKIPKQLLLTEEQIKSFEKIVDVFCGENPTQSE